MYATVSSAESAAVVISAAAVATWSAIEARFGFVRTSLTKTMPEWARRAIEDVMERYHDAAWKQFSGFDQENEIGRVHFWKQKLLEETEEAKRGLAAVYFHEYCAATLRADAEAAGLPSYGGEPRAQIDTSRAVMAGMVA